MSVAKQQLAFENSLDHLLAGLAYIDLRVRWAVARARAGGLNPHDEYRGLYISESQVDQMLQGGVGQTLWASAAPAASPAEKFADKTPGSNGTARQDGRELLAQARADWVARTAAARAAGQTLGLDRLALTFGLSDTEIDVLLLVLAPDFDPRYVSLYSYLQDDVTRKRPTVDLVLNMLTTSFREKLALRSLFAWDAPLLRARLLTLDADASAREPGLLAYSLRPETAVVEYLLGEQRVDQRLADCVTVALPTEFSPSSHLDDALAARLVAAAADEPLFAFTGSYGDGRRAAARHLAHALDRPLLFVELNALEKSELDLSEGIALALRDGRLMDAVLYLSDWDVVFDGDGRPPAGLVDDLLNYPGLIIVAGSAMWQPEGRQLRDASLRVRAIYAIAFPSADDEARHRVWQYHLDHVDVVVEGVASYFRFTPGQIEDAIATARDLARWQDEPLSEEHLFAASRAHSNQRLGTLATKIKPRYRWGDIVLPDDTFQQLQEMVNMVRQRGTVFFEWGFDRKLALGKGLYALFAGEPGTGKTMAAEIMAGELGLDLYKIDLSTLVSKYIGETEKNLDRIFTEAATSNAILFFDEADAIFGKRSEVKDRHDRYANIEISYLLQRMETYEGVVILATNLRANMDDAFTRRLHFAIEFPFPEPADRERIWRVTFPSDTPLDPAVDFALLARRFRITGGNIRNVILAAAFLAADEKQMVGMRQLLHATRREFQKMGRLIDDRQFRLPERGSVNDGP